MGKHNNRALREWGQRCMIVQRHRFSNRVRRRVFLNMKIIVHCRLHIFQNNWCAYFVFVLISEKYCSKNTPIGGHASSFDKFGHRWPHFEAILLSQVYANTPQPSRLIHLLGFSFTIHGKSSNENHVCACTFQHSILAKWKLNIFSAISCIYFTTNHTKSPIIAHSRLAAQVSR